MDGGTEQDMENLLRGGTFSNPAHKAALRRRLFDENMVLQIEDLEGVAGGVTAEPPFSFDQWPDEPDCLQETFQTP